MPRRAEKATAMLVVDDRQFIGCLLNAEKGFKRFQRKTSKSGGTFGKAMGGLAGGLGIGRLGVAGAFAAAGVAAGAAVKDALDFDRALTDLDIASNGAVGSLGQVRRRVLDVSKDTGVAKEDILAGAAAFVRLTGDGKAAADSMTTFARVQKATGATMDDIAGTAAAMSQQFGIGASEYERAFSILVAGGKAGAIEMKQMAEFSAELASQFKNFKGGKGLTGLADMSAAFQIAAKNFGGKAAETATGLQRLFSSFTTKRTQKELKKLGVQVFKVGKDGKAQLKSFPEIFEAMSRTKIVKDPRLLTKIFESSEARRAAAAILENVGAYKELAAATRNADDVASDYAKRQASDSAKVEKAWNNVKLAVAEAFTPERVQNLAAALTVVLGVASELVGVLSAMIDMLDDPRVLGDKVVKELPGAIESTVLGAFGGFRKPKGPITKSFSDLSKRATGADRQGTISGALETARNVALTGGTGTGEQLSPDFYSRSPTPTLPGGGGVPLREGPQTVNVTVGLDRDTNVKARIDNHRSQARTP